MTNEWQCRKGATLSMDEKFWSVMVVSNPDNGINLLIRSWGKLNTVGTIKVEGFGSETRCFREMADLLRSKTRKGYNEAFRVNGSLAEVASLSLLRSVERTLVLRNGFARSAERKITNHLLLLDHPTVDNVKDFEGEWSADFPSEPPSRPEPAIEPDRGSTWGSWS